MQIAAAVYEPGDAKALDDLFCQIAAELIARGVRLAGTVQHNKAANANSCARMSLHDLVSSRTFDISVPASAKMTACSLDPAALEDVAGHVSASIGPGTDLVLINRFGKQEVLGCGLRSAIEQAAVLELPLLTALCSTHLESWEAFAGDDWTRLTLDKGAILHWCHQVTPLNGRLSTHVWK